MNECNSYGKRVYSNSAMADNDSKSSEWARREANSSTEENLGKIIQIFNRFKLTDYIIS